MSVVAFHAFPGYLKGGFVGVDVFFISDFVISSLIFNCLDERSFSFVDFYSRRVRCIFPALVIVLIACLLMGALMLFSVEYMRLDKHVINAAAFVSNLLLWNESGYFDIDAQTKPLLHLWSLGIEEQFYIAWPILLFLIWKRKVAAPIILGVLLLASFAWDIFTIESRTENFYSPFTRFWELALGAGLALLATHRSAVGATIDPRFHGSDCACYWARHCSSERTMPSRAHGRCCPPWAPPA